MVPMQVSWFCPRDCDRLPQSVGVDVTSIFGFPYMAAHIQPGSEIPSQATKGIWVDRKFRGMPLPDVVRAHKAEERWLITCLSSLPGQMVSHNQDLLLFWEKK